MICFVIYLFCSTFTSGKKYLTMEYFDITFRFNDKANSLDNRNGISIDSVRNLQQLSDSDPKFECVYKTHALINHFSLVEDNEKPLTWITSSIVLSELSKFENKDAVDELQRLFNTSNIEVINFTRKEAYTFKEIDYSSPISTKY